MRGCTFAETFETPAKVVENGGTITGTPTIDFGATLSGSGDYITYKLRGAELNSANISIVIEFWPDFDTDDDNTRYLFDTTDGLRYYAFKVNNAGSNELRINLGNTSIASVAEATYSPYWKTGERNVLVISGTSGDTSVWLNGTAIVSNDSSVWTPSNPTELFIGARFSGSLAYDGKVTAFKIFNQLLTAQEASDYYTNSTYDYMNDTVVDLPMTLETHDPTNNRTLDVSGNGLHGTLGAGDGGVTTPTKNTDRCGYNYDADDDYINLGNNALLRPTDGLTISVWSVDTADANVEIVNYRESGGSGIFALYKVTNAICAIKTSDDVSETASHDAEHQNGVWTHTVLTFSQDDQEVRSYIQGIVQADIEPTADLPLATELAGLDNVYIGSATATLRNWGGDIAMFKLWDKRLTPLQIADLHQRELKKINCA